MKAEILAVGTEILLGDIVNTNAAYLSQKLAELGILVYHQSVVGDNPQRLKNALHQALNDADLVITTGGLGPTKDDLTKEMVAEYFGKKMILDEASLKKIEDFFHQIEREIGVSNKKQAYYPAGSLILPNENGTAPGCLIEEEGKIVISLPGPPKEMKDMFEKTVWPYLQKFSQGVLLSKVLRVTGIGESGMAEKISYIIDRQANPTVAPYAKETEAILRITAKGKDIAEAEKIIQPVEKAIRERLGADIYGEGDTSLEEVVAKMLLTQKKTIAVAESCTGGMIAAKLVNYPGISNVFMEGSVTYSNEAKMRRLKVKKETLDKFGAVSAETAAEMAQGIAATAQTDIGLSTTGIAGPDGGTDEKPVGLVYIGLSINGVVQTKKIKLNGDRNHIRNMVASISLDWLRRKLAEKASVL